MSRNLRLETLIFLECLGEAALDAAGALMNPSVGRFTGCGGDDEPLERKLRRMAARGVITLPAPADPRTVRLTEAGRRLVTGGIDLPARWSRPWDRTWRMVLFDVAEHERTVRTKLRHALRRARLGYLQGSVWISPDPLDELRKKIKSMTANPEALLFFEGHPFAGESDAALVSGGWSFSGINDAYRESLAILAAMPKADEAPRRWREWLEREHTAWVRATFVDPFLPECLLPPDYLGRTAYEVRRTTLKHAATHIFRAR